MDTDYKNLDYETIFQTFLAETTEQFRDMEQCFVTLETQPENQETLNEIFRIVHTIKGSSSSLELNSVSRCAHEFEDVLAGLRDNSILITSESITVLLQTVDALRQVVATCALASEETTPECEAFLLRMAGMRDARENREKVQGSGAVVEASSSRNAGSPLSDQSQTLRVDSAKLDRMLTLTSELLISRGRLRELLQAERLDNREEVSQSLETLDRLFLELQEVIMKSRMVPLGPIFRQYVRIVRDLAESTGKSVRIFVEGEEAEVDTSIVEHLRGPLTHLIRNAVDHGIEPEKIRIQKGKYPCGRIDLSAYRQGGSIVIRVADDGAGIDRERVVEQAMLRGIISETASLSDQEMQRLILLPGFSTSRTITEVSGRGVGMDVVCRSIEAIHGSVEVESRPSEGTVITMRLPLTLAIIEGFIVGVGSETYVIPMATVTECLDLTTSDSGRSDPGGLISIRGEAVPFLRLRKLFDIEGQAPERESLVVVKHESGQAGFAVDTLYGEGQLVIKPLGRLFKQLPGVSASTILDSGRVALVLDIPGLIRESTGQSRLM
jgi:two-component system chemotaxis sensor kinase CheA